MRVSKLVLTNFRNYSELDVDFGQEDRIFLSGDNGSGKTNLIESIYYLTLGRSFKKSEDIELILGGSDKASIYLTYVDDKTREEHSLSCVLSKKGKTFAYDGEKVRSLSQLLGKVLTVYYDPSQVFLFKEEPAERRRLLDETLSILSPEYLYAIGRYKKLLKERNAALSKMEDTDILDVLRNELIALSYRIVLERRKLMADLSVKAEENYRKLFRQEHGLKLLYQTNCPKAEGQKEFTQLSLKLFEENRSYENIRGQTTIGPHRDNILCLLDEKDIAGYGSQGENRIATLSLKLAIQQVMKEKLGSTPILLLDDVVSDLDEIRTQALLSSIEEGCQVFVTGTKAPEDKQNYQIYVVENGKILRRNA